jgi:hypothetical protein
MTGRYEADKSSTTVETSGSYFDVIVTIGADVRVIRSRDLLHYCIQRRTAAPASSDLRRAPRHVPGRTSYAGRPQAGEWRPVRFCSTAPALRTAVIEIAGQVTPFVVAVMAALPEFPALMNDPIEAAPKNGRPFGSKQQPIPIPRTCRHCDEPFVARATNQQFCCAGHRIAYRLKPRPPTLASPPGARPIAAPAETPPPGTDRWTVPFPPGVPASNEQVTS